MPEKERKHPVKPKDEEILDDTHHQKEDDDLFDEIDRIIEDAEEHIEKGRRGGQ